MQIDSLYNQLIKYEGFRLKPYRNSNGHLIIGIGRDIEKKGITHEEARRFLENDIAECVKDLATIFPNHFVRMPELLQRVLIDMRFQLGPGGFRGFKMMIRAVRRDDLPGMIREMKNSNWYRQTTERADDLIGMVSQFTKA
jgi:lysozyme